MGKNSDLGSPSTVSCGLLVLFGVIIPGVIAVICTATGVITW